MNMLKELEIEGYIIQENFSYEQECKDLLELVCGYRQNFSVPKIHRNVRVSRIHSVLTSPSMTLAGDDYLS